MSDTALARGTGGVGLPAAEGSPKRWFMRIPVWLGIELTLFALILSIKDGISGFRSYSPSSGEQSHGFLGPWDAVDSALFVLWPLLATLGIARGWRTLAWLSALAYVVQALLFGFSEGGPHLTFGVPVLLLALVLDSIGRVHQRAASE